MSGAVASADAVSEPVGWLVALTVAFAVGGLVAAVLGFRLLRSTTPGRRAGRHDDPSDPAEVTDRGGATGESPEVEDRDDVGPGSDAPEAPGGDDGPPAAGADEASAAPPATDDRDDIADHRTG